MADVPVEGIDPPLNRELQLLSVTYASGVDRRNREMLLTAFHSDATLTIANSTESVDGQPVVLQGHDQIGRITDWIAVYSQTFHFIGQSSFTTRDTGVMGEVSCIAHHRWSDEVELDHVMYIRYQDNYRVGADNRWRIAARTVRADWTETKVVDVPGRRAR